MQQLRANLFLMRKNVKRVPRQGSAVSAREGTRVKKLEQDEEAADSQKSSKPAAEPNSDNANVLALPNIKNKKNQKRPGSTQNRRDDEDIQPPPSIIPHASEEVKGNRKSFHVKIIKMNEVDHELKERQRQE